LFDRIVHYMQLSGAVRSPAICYEITVALSRRVSEPTVTADSSDH